MFNKLDEYLKIFIFLLLKYEVDMFFKRQTLENQISKLNFLTAFLFRCLDRHQKLIICLVLNESLKKKKKDLIIIYHFLKFLLLFAFNLL